MSTAAVQKQEQFRASSQVLADSLPFMTLPLGNFDPRLVVVNPAPNASPASVPTSPTVTLTFPR
jgi:hypothetical protein